MMVLQLIVTEDFNNLTSLNIKFQQSNDIFATDTEDLMGERVNILAADLKANRTFSMRLPHDITKNTIRLMYDVVGTAPTTGKVFAAISSSDEQWYIDAQKLGGN